MSEAPHDPQNPYAGMPLHHLLFLKVRDGGGPIKVAHSVAELHEITIDELKAHCRRAVDDILADRALAVYEVPVAEWARR
ncbi:hypothetical protein LU673_25345 [Pseudomonas alloputida]|uniref:hypothetical protein n=1 Tax=Pseudomonas alloputida TaxID=1940621 RepID=UPI001E5C1C26|nr:hypothetical protein [Pseudomonas alloputida]MCE0923302.1 hypothetical protein [Pseudomonas alloputida]